MLGSIWWYLSKTVLIRWRELVFASEFWISLIISGATLWVANSGFFQIDLQVGDLASALLTYASIAFGFCLTGSALALTIPDREFARKMAGTTAKSRPCDTYSNLIFVFSWASLAHLFLVLASIGSLFIFKESDKLLPGLLYWKRSLFAFSYLSLTIYAFSQFVVTVITLSQVGDVYISGLKNGGFDKN